MIINITGEKSNPAIDGTTRRIGSSKGSTILSKNDRTGWYGDIKYDNSTSMITINEMTLKKSDSDVKRISPIFPQIESFLYVRGPMIAVPTRMNVAPSCTAVSKSELVPIESSDQSIEGI